MAVKTIVSWWMPCDNVSARSVATTLSGAPPEPVESVSQGAVAVAFHTRVAPSALVSRSVAMTPTREPACAESRTETGLTTKRSWTPGCTSLSMRHVATDMVSTKSKEPVAKSMAAG